MDKIIVALFDAVTKSKGSTPLFTLIAAAVALWAISGGAGNLFGATTVRELEANSQRHKKSLDACVVKNEAYEQRIQVLQNEVGQLKNMNEMLKLFLATRPVGTPTQPNNALVEQLLGNQDTPPTPSL